MNLAELSKFEDLRTFMWYFDESINKLLIEDSSRDLYLNFELNIPPSFDIENLALDTFLHSPELFSNIKIENIDLCKAFSKCEEEKDEYGFELMNGELFVWLQIFFQLFSRIPFYRIIENWGDVFCKGPTLLQIELCCNGLSIFEINAFYKDISNINKREFEKFKLDIIYREKETFSKKRKIEIINTNTKVRRLGYLKFIIELFNRSKFFPTNYFARLIEKESTQINNEINLHFDNKGLIQLSRTGNSSKPYVELLVNLSLITIINNVYILTKQSKVYFEINKLISKSKFPAQDSQLELFPEITKSKFQLNLFDKSFFLKQILLKDTLYSCGILDILRITNDWTNSNTIKSLFKQYLIDDLRRTDIKNDYEVREIVKRINSWKKEMIYLEHIIEPRLNWLVDLELISVGIKEKNKKLYKLNQKGQRLQEIFTTYYEISPENFRFIGSFFDNNYFKIFSIIYGVKKEPTDVSESVILKLLEEAFHLFKTEAPKRIPASIAINYICYKYFFQFDKIVEYKQIQNYLLGTKSNIFGVDWFSSENDGSMFLKN